MSVVTATITDEAGKAMPATHELLSLDVEREVGRIPRCRLRLLDGDLVRGTFPISDSALFAPGAVVKVALRYEGQADAPVFAGVVVRHGLQISTRGSILAVELMDRAVALTRPRKSVVHKKTSDAAVIRTLVSAAGLKVAAAAKTAPAEHAELVQYDASDWDFIVTRAAAQGLVIAVTDGALTLADVTAKGKVTHAFKFGKDELLSVDLETDGLYQPGKLKAVAWDAEALAASEKSAAAIPAVKADTLGAPDGAGFAAAVGFGETVLRHVAPLKAAELQAWADGQVARARKSMVRGRISVPGRGAVALLDAIKLVGFGERFAGASTITGIRHRVSKNGWTTDLQFGFSPEQLARPADGPAPPAGGLLPGVTSLQLGVVVGADGDPPGAYQIRVLVPAIDPDDGVVWARIAAPEAGSGRGHVFRPEPGDEVVVGFLNGDPRQAIILGALFSAKNAPPADIDPEKQQRGLVSKSGVAIAFTDADKPTLSITTPGGRTFEMSDEQGAITVKDGKGNEIAFDDKGITIKSAGDITLDGSSGNIQLKASKVEAK